MKQSRSVNLESFPSAPTMGAPTGVTAYVKTVSLPKNGSHQKWLHEALILLKDGKTLISESTYKQQERYWSILGALNMDLPRDNFPSLIEIVSGKIDVLVIE